MKKKRSRMKTIHPGTGIWTFLGILVLYTVCSTLLVFNPAYAATASLSTQDCTADPLVRQTAAGWVRGAQTDYDTWAWKGIPFAKAPVGNLRWKAPRDAEPWYEVLDATSFRNHCVQYGDGGMDALGMISGEPSGNEDCLFLNVWRPATSAAKLPVFVYVYGGGFNMGSSSNPVYDGAHFSSRENVLVVTMNYRVGHFGWFWHPALQEGSDPKDNSGNYGTLDIIKSLEWVRNNIESFGGDPNNVTICGESGGGANVYTMLVSPLAKGLFHRAVDQSGFTHTSSKDRFAQAGDAMLKRLMLQDGYSLLKILYTTKFGSKTWIRNYLRSKTSAEIYPKGNALAFMPIDSLLSISLDSLGPISDGYVLPTASPQDSVASGNYNKVPLMAGSTRDETGMFLLLDIFAGVPLSDFKNDIIGIDTLASSAKQYQDDVYVYKFNWDEEAFPLNKLVGAFHGTDVPFWSGNLDGNLFSFTINDANRPGAETLSNAMMDYLGQFMRAGNPNGGNPDLPQWLPWSNNANEPKRIIFDTGDLVMSNE